MLLDNDKRDAGLAELLETVRNAPPDSAAGTDAFGCLCVQYANLLDSLTKQFAPSLGIGGKDSVSELLGIGLEDLRQEAVMALYKAAVTYVPDEEGKGSQVSFGLYAKICIRNAMISQVRRANGARRRRDAVRRKAEDQRNAQVLDVYPAEAPEAAEETLRRFKEHLSAYEYAVLPLYSMGKPPREIALLLGRTEKSVSNAIYRIKVKLRGLLEKK